jgi:hypothetical protein
MSKNALSFPIWKTIKIGIFKSVEVLRKAVKEKGSEPGFGVGETMWGGDYPEHEVAMIMTKMKGFTIVDEEKEIDLVVLQSRDLLGDEWIPLLELYKKMRKVAHEIGLEDCPPEVGPLLYLAGVEEGVCVGMEPIHPAHTLAGYCAFRVSPKVLGVKGNLNYGPWICGDTKVVFVRPR